MCLSMGLSNDCIMYWNNTDSSLSMGSIYIDSDISSVVSARIYKNSGD